MNIFSNAHEKRCCDTTIPHASVMNVELIRIPTFHFLMKTRVIETKATGTQDASTGKKEKEAIFSLQSQDLDEGNFSFTVIP